MQLRPFHASDLATLSKIDQGCFPPSISYSLEELEGFIAQPNSRTWVAVEGDTVVGFLIADCEDNGVGHIITIDVLEAWRRRGVGNTLMDAAEGWAMRLRLPLIYLETVEDNLSAQRFYEARGYVKLKKIEHYYTNGAAAWVMIKKLKGKTRVDARKVEHRTSGR